LGYHHHYIRLLVEKPRNDVYKADEKEN